MPKCLQRVYNGQSTMATRKQSNDRSLRFSAIRPSRIRIKISKESGRGSSPSKRGLAQLLT